MIGRGNHRSKGISKGQIMKGLSDYKDTPQLHLESIGSCYNHMGAHRKSLSQ